MAKRSYNGHVLPATPEVDKVNPYTFITRKAYDTGGVVYRFIARPTPAEVSSRGTCGTVEGVNYRLVDEGWTQDATLEVGVVIWADHDVYYLDAVADVGGTLYLAASEPIPVTTAPETDPEALLLGWELGDLVRKQRGKVVQPEQPSGEIVAYLYNGVRQPDINEVWTDKEAHHWAALIAFGGRYRVVFSSSFSVDTSSGVPYVSFTDYYRYVNPDFKGDSVWASDGYNAGTWGISASYIFWSNFDILNEDGTVYLAASDPIPVYA